MQVVAAGGEALGDPGSLPGGAGCASHWEPCRVCLPAAGADRRLLQRAAALCCAGQRPGRRPVCQPAPLRQASGRAIMFSSVRLSKDSMMADVSEDPE